MTVAIAKEDNGNVDFEKKKGKSESKVKDSTSEVEVKQKKKSKKRKHEEIVLEQIAEAGTEVKDAEEASEKKKKKKKKRSHDAEKAGEDVEMQAIVEENEKSDKKDKKDKKKDKKDKNSKKDKKKKHSETTTAESSKAASPSRSMAPKASPSEISKFLAKNNVSMHVPPGRPEVIPILAFDQLDIPDSLRSFSAKFKEPSPIQACAWPLSLDGKDVVGIAETGSGKTLAFGIPALARLILSPLQGTSTITTLVLAPTRELALQTHETLSTLGQPLGIACVAVFGGVPKEPQVKMLKNLDKGKTGLTTRVIVGTPGRILDLMSEGVCDLSNVNFLVLDEADRMLDKGFENDIRKIISKTKPSTERQTLMFSATWPEAVRRLASTFQNNPVRVTVGSDDLTANSRVEQSVEVLDDGRQKDSRLLYHLRNLGHPKRPKGGSDEARIIVFALYKKETSRVEQMLIREGYATSALHGDINQNARMQALENFKNGQTGILVATDVAARGLDIPNVKAVINYTYPLTTEDYIHRIGRTGRGGQHGKSITFFTGENQERGLAGELLRVLKDSGFDCPGLQKFPMTIKKKEHSAYGAFYRDDIPVTERKKIVFE
ncbi:atp-dependent rna helicase dbp3 [Moniliophthora roreri]|uniref:RNA helicase n=1 Tax=Moniliophthora roreri TaxID=221103 RepID=A0A0W0F5V5_MONRR|nr:atp-dependent rna helicase dbp3 [Moniliophthora roreri]